MTPSETYSCLMSASFGWSLAETSGMESRQQQSYLFQTRLLNKVGGNESDYPLAVVTTKLKVRGFGQVMSLRYESEEGKDFQLIGLSTPFATTTEG